MKLIKLEASPRWINLVVGLWLIASTFVWPHTPLQLANALVVGAGCAIAAGLATRAPHVRYVNVGLGLWLYASGWFVPVARTATLNNHAIISAIMILIALVPSRRERMLENRG
jgi:hypothetical protein